MDGSDRTSVDIALGIIRQCRGSMESAASRAQIVMDNARALRSRLNPGDHGYAEATVHLAWALAESREHNKALELLNEIIQNEPVSLPLIMAYCDKACLLHANGSTNDASGLLEAALRLVSGADRYNTQYQAYIAAAAAEISQPPTGSSTPPA